MADAQNLLKSDQAEILSLINKTPIFDQIKEKFEQIEQIQKKKCIPQEHKIKQLANEISQKTNQIEFNHLRE